MKYLHPPHRKQGDAFANSTEWYKIEQKFDEDTVREAIYDGLQAAYRDHIEVNHAEDYHEMEKNIFEEVVFAYERRDRAKLAQRKLDLAKAKAEKAKKESKSTGKRSGTKKDSEESKKQRKHCDFCKKNGAPAFVYQTHNEEDCNKKSSGGNNNKKHGKERFQTESKKLEQLMKENRAMHKRLKKDSKKFKKALKKSGSYESDSSSDEDSDWLDALRHTKKRYSKWIARGMRKQLNKIDKIIKKSLKEHFSSSSSSSNVVISPTIDTKDGTPVVLITIYDLKHNKKVWRE